MPDYDFYSGPLAAVKSLVVNSSTFVAACGDADVAAVRIHKFVATEDDFAKLARPCAILGFGEQTVLRKEGGPLGCFWADSIPVRVRFCFDHVGEADQYAAGADAYVAFLEGVFSDIATLLNDGTGRPQFKIINVDVPVRTPIKEATAEHNFWTSHLEFEQGS